MCKKQPWNKETHHRQIEWSMPAAFDVAESETGTENHDPDLDHGDDPRHYFTQFRDNLAHIDDWKQYEVLELIKQKVVLGYVTIPWLDQFREDLDLKV